MRRRVEVDGANLTDARPGQDSQRGGGWVVNFTFDSVGARRFADVTNANVGRRFAIVLDDKVISAPVIQTPITAAAAGRSAATSTRGRPTTFRCCCAQAPCRRR